jgi:hypothetical protein
MLQVYAAKITPGQTSLQQIPQERVIRCRESVTD